MTETHSNDPIEDKLDSIRRSLDLRLDGEGRWWHEGQPFQHPYIIDAFNKGISLDGKTGEPIVRIGERFCYFTVEVTPFIVRRLFIHECALWALLNNGEKTPVPDDGLYSSNERIYVQLNDGRAAVLDRQAQLSVANLVQPDSDALLIQIGPRSWLISERNEES